jgi:ketosteroid isomerase-like protein
MSFYTPDAIRKRTGADSGKETGRGRYVTMWRREGQRWLVIMDTGYPDPATPAQ